MLPRVARVSIVLYGSLGATGRGHGTDRGVILGLAGKMPETVTGPEISGILDMLRTTSSLVLSGSRRIAFDPRTDIVFRVRPLDRHPNGLTFHAFDVEGAELMQRTYYSIGGGALLHGDDSGNESPPRVCLPHPFGSGQELLRLCQDRQCSVSELVYANEACMTPAGEIHARLDAIWRAMEDCVRRGVAAEGELPGPLKVSRRAKDLHDFLLSGSAGAKDALHAMDWLNVWAMAVNEENASGGQVVTAPTNGAAGIIPSVLHYYMRFIDGAGIDGVRRFLLTAAAIGMLYKLNASISGAEVGCQGEVGVACSMAAGGLCEVLGGTPGQVEQAAEIAMEHHLGLTCDPVGGLVQIPCIERNAVASAKAVNAARLALRSRVPHHVSLDAVIQTMWQTGQDMKTKYKETSRGGLAINIKQC
ncbi:L-serine ammonia-lyase [Bordetella sputigena]